MNAIACFNIRVLSIDLHVHDACVIAIIVSVLSVLLYHQLRYVNFEKMPQFQRFTVAEFYLRCLPDYVNPLCVFWPKGAFGLITNMGLNCYFFFRGDSGLEHQLR